MRKFRDYLKNVFQKKVEIPPTKCSGPISQREKNLTPLKSKIALYGSVASIIGIIITIAVFGINRFQSKKDLSIQLISKDTWFSRPLESDFQLTYKGEAVENVATFLLEIRNTGRQPIRPIDFEKSIELTLKGTQKIISVNQVDQEPSDLKLQTNYENNLVHIEPTLFNESDMVLVSIKALCSASPTLDIDLSFCRIAGIKIINFEEKFIRKESWTDALFSSWVFCMLVAVLIINISVITYNLRKASLKVGTDLEERYAKLIDKIKVIKKEAVLPKSWTE